MKYPGMFVTEALIEVRRCEERGDLAGAVEANETALRRLDDLDRASAEQRERILNYKPTDRSRIK